MSNVSTKFGSKQLTEVCSPPAGHRVYAYGPWPSTLSTLMAGQMQEAGYEELLGEDNGKKKRITFIGACEGDLMAGEDVIVSFPGVHGAVWEFLTERGSPIQTTCVFLPDLDDDKKNGAGEHCKTGNEGDKCYCYLCLMLCHKQKGSNVYRCM